MQPHSRRTFLRTGLAGGAALLAPGLVRAGQNPPPPISFSFSLYGMRTLALDAALRTCADIGYTAVELAAMADWHADPPRLDREARVRVRDQLRQLRLGLPALMENTPLTVTDEVHRTQMDRLRRAAELGHDLSPAAPPLIETILGGRVGEWEQVRDRFASRLGDWARLAEQARTIIAVKPHRMGAMNTPEHALWLKQRVNSQWIQLAYDYSHFQHRDMTLADTLRAMLPHTRFVHVKDVRVQNGQTEFLLPGDGNIDFTALLRQLREGRYGGTVCVEVSGQIHSRPGYDPAATARRCFANLAPAFRQAGIML